MRQVEEKKSSAEKLYDLVTLSPALPIKYRKHFFNPQSRIFSAHNFIQHMGTEYDRNPKHETDLEVLENGVGYLERQIDSEEWKELYDHERVLFERFDVEQALNALQGYIARSYVRDIRIVESRETMWRFDYEENDYCDVVVTTGTDGFR